MELLPQVGVREGLYSTFIVTVLGAFRGQFTQHHLWVVDKIAVQRDTIFRFAQMNPVGFCGNDPFPLL